MIRINIDNKEIAVAENKTILEAALDAGIYIPHLCYHPEMDPVSEIRSIEKVYQGKLARHGKGKIEFTGCNLCLVEIQDREGPVQSCRTFVEDGMSVCTDSDTLNKTRQDNLAKILESHPHACLLCPQAAGCDRKICSIQIPEIERCCFKFGICELQKVAGFIGMEKGLPPYEYPGLPVVENEPLIIRNFNLCIGCLRCVRVCRDVKGADALGFTIEEGKVVVGSKGPTMKESGCQFCGYCVEVCPTGSLIDKDIGAGEREHYLIPCKNNCPAEIDVPRYTRLIKNGEYEKALKVIYEKVPFPAVLGRICFHPCEISCRRGSLDQPVAICALKRTAADLGELLSPRPDVKEKSGKKVAVIGSGPAGLTAAYYLNISGHSVTVFEALPETGGMMRVGIPSFRLPRNVLDREIRAIEDTGIEIKVNHRVESLEELYLNGFHSIFMAVGAQKAQKLGIRGEDTKGVLDGITFLRNVNLGREVAIGERVAVIGGGNVAIDSARSALRLGAKEVTIFYRRTRNEMPAYDEELESSLEEGVKIEYQVSPGRIENLEGALSIEFIRMEMGNIDETKRPRSVPIEGSEFKMLFDTVITAIGQLSEIPEGVVVPPGDRFEVEADAGKGIFIGGDLLAGPLTVIDAIKSGRRGAVLIDKFLGGDGDIDNVFVELEPAPLRTKPITIEAGRSLIPMLPAGERASCFSEVCLGLDEQTAIDEASRCLECDLRFQIRPVFLPPETWVILSEENIQGLPDAEGVYILYDEQKELYKICGVENIRQSLLEEYGNGSVAGYFNFEEDPMFTTKERQLIQQYIKEYGRMPPGSDELDELF